MAIFLENSVTAVILTCTPQNLHPLCCGLAYMHEPAGAIQNLVQITASWPWPALCTHPYAAENCLQSALCSWKLVRSNKKTFHFSGNESSRVEMPISNTKLVGVLFGLAVEKKRKLLLSQLRSHEKKLDLSTFSANTPSCQIFWG